MALYEAQRHEPLTDTAWDEGAARAALARIVADTNGAFTEAGLWPIHPFDVSPERADALTPLYYGAAGVIWTLRLLHESGLAELERDYLPAVSASLGRQRADALRLTGAPILAYPIGEAGILLLHWTMAPSDALADAHYVAIEANSDHPSLGFVWGAPGSMLAALFMFERTRDERWKALYLRLFEVIWRAWKYDEAFHCYLWMHDLYGVREKRLSAIHGLAGNVACMFRGRALLSKERQDELVRRAHEAVAATAVREDEYANWPLAAEKTDAIVWRVQHCIGAPGVVNCFAPLPAEPEVDALLLAAGELIWRAGPVTKLPSLCHGVPGSGYAFLKLFARTGDEKWLMRARRFAMHAVLQAEHGVAAYGQRKFSLWTGDLGLAAYLRACILRDERFPTLDFF